MFVLYPLSVFPKSKIADNAEKACIDFFVLTALTKPCHTAIHDVRCC